MQPAVLRVTSKFQYGRKPQDVKLTQSEVKGLASVYVRIYALPDITRDRLKKWLRSNLPLAQSWRLDFFNTREQDRNLGIVPRPPGVPAAALTNGVRIGDRGEEIPNPRGRSDQDGEASAHGTPDTPGSPRTPDTPATLQNDQEAETLPEDTAGDAELPAKGTRSNNSPNTSAQEMDVDSSEEDNITAGEKPLLERLCGILERNWQEALIPPKDLHPELEAARDALKDAAVVLQSTAFKLNNNDPLCQKLLDWSMHTVKASDRATKALGASRARAEKEFKSLQKERERREREKREPDDREHDNGSQKKRVRFDFS